jgi:hypothetical protein
VGNLYVFSRHCCIILHEQVNNCIVLTRNTMVVQDKIEKYTFVQTLTKELIKVSIHANKIKNSGTNKRGSGTMLDSASKLDMIRTIFLGAILLQKIHMGIEDKLFLKNG